MYGFFSSYAAGVNDIGMLDEHLRADIGLATHDTPPNSPSNEPPAARPNLADILRTSARAFALPLAITDTCLG